MKPEVKKQVMSLALALWGQDAQCLQAIEEMAELTHKLCHLSRARVSTNEVITEMVDVEIMLDQLKHMFVNEANKHIYEQALEYKWQRLAKLCRDSVQDLKKRRKTIEEVTSEQKA